MRKDKIKAWIATAFFFSSGHAATIGLVGGFDNLNGAYASFIDSSTLSANAIPGLSSFTGPNDTSITPVAINRSGLGLIGGPQDSAFAAFLDSATNTATIISGTPGTNSTGGIYSVAINDFGLGLIGGVDDANAGYAAIVDVRTNAATTLSNIPNLSMNGLIQSVAINNAGFGLIGGENDSSDGYAGIVDLNTKAATTISNIPLSPGFIQAVAINNANLGLIGGSNDVNGAYAAFIDPNTNAATVISNIPDLDGYINSVAINNACLGLIGGSDDADVAYAAFVNPNTNTATTISNIPNMSTQSYIYSVSINDNGLGLIGGLNDADTPYAAFVDSNTNTATTITGLPVTTTGIILTVSINEFGQGLIGGTNDSNNAYAALVDPATNQATTILNLLGGNSAILGVAMLTKPIVPTSGLFDNNLSFANYINTYAQNVVFYFIPSVCADNLKMALESAAPTRNAISLFAADNNLFSLNHGLSAHLRNHRHFKNRRRPPMPTEMSSLESSQENLIASNELAAGCVESGQLLLKILDKQNAKLAVGKTQTDAAPTEQAPNTKSLPAATHLPSSKERCRPYTLWFEAIGSFASQNKQDQTVGFDPKTGGFIFAFDKLANENILAGGGIAYTFTHVSEDQSQGHSDINQEYLFLYTSWENFGMYVDGALWASIFQTHQARNIHLTSFQFKSISHPEGFQLTSHFELGYNKEKPLYTSASFDFFINPFTMLDWANNWQQSYQEKGNSPFNAGQNAQYSSFLRTEAGLRFYETFFFKKWTLLLEEKGSYVNKTPFNVGRVNAFLVGSAGSFTVETFTSSQNLGVVEMLFGFEPINRCYPYGSLSYQGEFGSGFQSHQVTTEVSWDF